MRKKSGEIMKALGIGTPVSATNLKLFVFCCHQTNSSDIMFFLHFKNFLTEEDMKEWNRQPWGTGR